MTGPTQTWSRGALVTAKEHLVQRAIVFQINPSTVTRTLTAEPVAASRAGRPVGDDEERLGGAPKETLSMQVELDALDGHSTAGEALPATIEPQLYALELLVYPDLEAVTEAAALAKEGRTSMSSGFAAPLTLLVWGTNRVLPVRLGSYTITEEAFNSRLAPVRATVDLEMTVLSYSGVRPDHPAFHLAIAQQTTKSRRARSAVVSDAEATSGVSLRGRL